MLQYCFFIGFMKMSEDKNIAIVCLSNIYMPCLTYFLWSVNSTIGAFPFYSWCYSESSTLNFIFSHSFGFPFLGRRCILCADGGQGDRNMANITSLAMPDWPAARRRMSSHPNCQQKSISPMDPPIFSFREQDSFSMNSVFLFTYISVCDYLCWELNMWGEGLTK